MKQHFRVTQLQDIEDNRLYNIHPFLDNTQLNTDIAQSIQLIGLLTPPVVIEKTGGRYEIICGRQRLRCISSLNEKSCYCQILHNDCSAETILAIILEDQFANGPLTIIEQACFIKICNQLLPDKKRRHSFFQSLLPGRITKGIHYLTPLAELEKSLQSAIHHGILSDKIVAQLLLFNCNDQKILLYLIESTQIGGNNQKRLVIQLHDILRRNDITLATFVEREEIQEILQNSNIERSDKASRLLEVIGSLHQPLLTSYRDSFKRQITALKLPDTITIIPSSSFEKDDVTMHVRFSSFEAFKMRWASLERYLND